MVFVPLIVLKMHVLINHTKPISCIKITHYSILSLVILQYILYLCREKNALEFRSQAMPELLTKDLPSSRPWYLVSEDNFPYLLVWSNLPEMCWNVKNYIQVVIWIQNYQRTLVYHINKNLLSNIVHNVLRGKYTSNLLDHVCHWNLPSFFIHGTDIENDGILIWKTDRGFLYIAERRTWVNSSYLRCNSNINYFRMQY